MNNRKPCELLLIDGDTLVYRYGLMNHESVDFEECTPVSPFEAAKLAISQKLQFLLEDTGVPDFRIALAPAGVKCFRYGFYPQYKAHRGVPPDIIRPLRQWLRTEYHEKLLHYPGTTPVETDDIIGYFHKGDGSTCVVSNDKDFLTLPGWNYHPFTGDLIWVTHTMAHVCLWYQVLVGDSADGFPGCQGIGPKKALEILTTALEHCYDCNIRDVVLFTYLSQGQTLDDFLTNWCLAMINGCCETPESIKEWADVTLPPDYEKLLKEIL